MDKKALMEELEQLGKLHQAGVLSQAEFDAEKADLLSQLRALRGGQTPMPSGALPTENRPISLGVQTPMASGVGGGEHGGDAFRTGFAEMRGGEVAGESAISGASLGSGGLVVGGVIGERYRLVRMLGRGGMGEVWLVEDTRLGRAFALKFLAAELVGSAEALSRMHREYEVLEKLTHPQIVRVFDLDQDKGSGRWYLRMEYVEGEDLGRKIALALQQAYRPLFAMEQLAGWLGQIVEALEYAHQRGILHRDIKPANLMLAADGALKVMDFGIARMVSGTHTTQHTAMMGSMYYAAPELLRGQAATPSVDIYSFGVLAYELLTGELPVGRFALPSAVVRGLSRGADDAVERMLSVNPKQRGKSLREAWLPLRDALLGKAAKVVSPPKPAQSPHYWSEKIAPPPQPNVADSSAGRRRVFCVGGVDFPMRWIPAGRFWMGSGDDDDEAYKDEKPRGEVVLTRGCWMGETPVTQGQYLAIMGENPSSFQGAGVDVPVERVSWYDAAAFANKLSALEGLSACFVVEGDQVESVGNGGSDVLACDGWRLPTEAEWEYAVRAGTTTPRYGDVDKIAWYRENSSNMTHRVGQKQPNAWGLYDMLGNVSEWTMDVWDAYTGQPTQDPLRSSGATKRVFRGGSWSDSAGFVRAAFRGDSALTFRNNYLGFRVVRTKA